MNCTNIGSLIVTIAIQMHGKVINLNLTPETQKIFNNVRLYSHAGDFKDVISTPFDDYNVLPDLDKLFQKNLNESSLNVINEYIYYSQPKYKSFLQSRVSDEYNEEDREKVCRLIHNINFDKSLSTTTLTDDNFINCLFEKFNYEFTGIFIVSIHEKVDEDNFTLIYPLLSDESKTKKLSNKNILDKNLNILKIENIKKLATLFNKEISLDFIKESFIIPVQDYLNREKIIKSSEYSQEEKNKLLLQQKNEFYQILKNWKITMKDESTIQQIKMSKLIEIIKSIFGENCVINLFDYSCNSATKYLPDEDRYNMKYLFSSDIENPPLKKWGGKSNYSSKRHKNKKNYKFKKSKKNKNIKGKTKKCNII
jgi:hypothetical protein